MATTVAGVTYTSHVCDPLVGLNWTTHVAAAVQPGDITPTLTPNSFTNTGHTLFVHINAAVGAKTVVFNAGSCNFGTDHDLTVSTDASTTQVYGPFAVSEFGTTVTFSCGAADTDIASVKVLIIEVPFVN
jgi:hypothetical protein